MVIVGTSWAETGKEVRGLWIVRNSITTPDKVKDLVNFADSLHFNVLFVQVRGRGDAFYLSDLVPGPEEYPWIPEKFDPLAFLIPLAHSRGIEVHAWLNIGLTWASRERPVHSAHILRMHPDWFMVSMNGFSMADCPYDSLIRSKCEGRYISPGLSGVREHLVRVAGDISRRYGIDGVHLDYVRFPGWNYDFHPVLRADFSRRYGIDPRAVITGEGRRDPSLTYLDMWTEYRAGQVSGLVRMVAGEIRRIDPKIRVSAAVKSDVEDAFYLYGQDWPGWLRDGTVDFVVMMSYCSRNEKFGETLEISLRNVDRRRVVAGVGMFLLSPEQAMEQIAEIRNRGLLGYCGFSYDSFRGNPELGIRLMKLVRAGEAGLPPEFKPYLRKKK